MRHQAAHQRQPDAEPALRAAIRAIDLREHVEDRCELVRRDADAVVAHGDRRAIVRPTSRRTEM